MIILDNRNKLVKEKHNEFNVMDLSVITVTHQSEGYIEDLILSVVSGALKSSVEHLIVDNASTDGTIGEIEDGYLPFVKLLKSRENVGFSAANNWAFGLSKGRYLLFLNPDMHVEEGSLDALVEWMDAHPDVGISSCTLVDEAGAILQHRAPRPFPTWGKNALWLLFPQVRSVRYKNLTGGEVDAVLGAFMVVRREVLERLGFAFDPRYFLTFEDCDLCREVRNLGYKIYYHADIRCVDYNSRSFAQKSPMWIFSQVARSMLIYFRKWGPWYAWVSIGLCMPIGYFVRYLMINKKKLN